MTLKSTTKRRKDLDKEYSDLIGKDVQVWETETQIVLFGEPSKLHNCDRMGCPTGSHILLRREK